MDQKKRQEIREFLHYTSALISSMETTLAPDNHQNLKYTSYWHFCRKFNQLIAEAEKIVKLPPFVDMYEMERLPKSGEMLPPVQKEYFDSVHANLSMLKAYFEAKLGIIEDEVSNLTYFLQSNLRRAIYDEPQRELDVQNAIETLLVG